MTTRSRHGLSFAQGSGQKRPRSQQREEVRLHRRADHIFRPPAPIGFTSGFHANAAMWKAVVLRLSAHKVGPRPAGDLCLHLYGNLALCKPGYQCAAVLSEQLEREAHLFVRSIEQRQHLSWLYLIDIMALKSNGRGGRSWTTQCR